MDDKEQPPPLTQAQQRKYETGDYATCPVCFAFRGCYVPKGGDGTMRIMRLHKHNGVRCDGTKEPGIGWE